MKRIFLGFLIVLGIGLSGCATPKTLRNKTSMEKSTVIVIKGDGDSVLIDGKIIKADTSLSMLLAPLSHDLASLRLFDGYEGIYFLKGELDSATRKYTIIIQNDTLIIPGEDSLYKCLIQNDKIVVGTDTVQLPSTLLPGDHSLSTLIIEGDKYIVGKDTFLMPKYEEGRIIINGDTMTIDESKLKTKDHKNIKVIKIIEDDSNKVKVEINGKEISTPQD
jgi:hypothetical protein